MALNHVNLKNSKSRELFNYLHEQVPVGTGKVVIRENEVELFSEYYIPIELLKFNDRNFRIRHQVESKHFEINNSKSDLEESDQTWIFNELLNFDNGKNDAVYNSILLDGLKEAVIVRLSDAVVVDGNRRFMTHKRLVADGYMDFGSIRAIVIDKELTDNEWLELEARYQFEPETKSYYDAINEAMILRDMFKVHGSFEVVARKASSKKSHVESRIYTLDLIEQYLETIGRPNDYSSVPAYALFEELAKELARKKGKLSFEEMLELETTGLNIISLRVLAKEKDLDLESETNESEITLDDRNFRKILKAFSLENAKDAMVQTVGSKKVLQISEMKEQASKFIKDINESLIIQDAQKQADEPERMIRLAISHLKTVQKISPDNRNGVVDAIIKVMEELTRIRELVKKSIKGD